MSFHRDVPAAACARCGRSIQEAGGRRLLIPRFRSEADVQAIGSEPVPADWADEDIRKVATNAELARSEQLEPWLCQRCLHRLCGVCRTPLRCPPCSDILHDDGHVTHAFHLGEMLGCANRECIRYGGMPEIVFEEVVELKKGHGTEIYHDFVYGRPVAFVLSYEWIRDRRKPVPVQVQKLVHSCPIKVFKKGRSNKHHGYPGNRVLTTDEQRTTFLAQESPDEWNSIIMDIEQAVRIFVKLSLEKGHPKQGRLTPRVRSWING